MQSLFFILFFSLSPLFSVAQQNPVHDPKGLLPGIAQFLKTQKFEQIFPCGSHAQFYTPVVSASFDFTNGIQTTYEIHEHLESKYEILDCHEDFVTLFTELGASYFIGKDEYENTGKNLAHLWLSKMTAFIGVEGEVHVDRVENATYKLASGRELDARHVFAEFRVASPKRKMNFLITVVQTPYGVAQIARFRLMDQTWFRLSDLASQTKFYRGFRK